MKPSDAPEPGMAPPQDPGAVPLPAPAEKAGVVQRMFGAIAPHYDLLNHLLSLNRDRAWRRKAIDALLEGAAGAGTYLDSCAGTLDLTRELAARTGFDGRVLACDFVEEMLRRGIHKVAGSKVDVVCGDALRLPLRDRSVDGATVGFGVRNLASLEAGLLELARVVRPGGRLVVLEFATPVKQPLRGLYLLYFHRILPLLGRLISRHETAYRYLPESVLAFPEPRALVGMLEGAGFEAVRWRTHTGGIVAIHEGQRAEDTTRRGRLHSARAQDGRSGHGNHELVADHAKKL